MLQCLAMFASLFVYGAARLVPAPRPFCGLRVSPIVAMYVMLGHHPCSPAARGAFLMILRVPTSSAAAAALVSSCSSSTPIVRGWRRGSSPASLAPSSSSRPQIRSFRRTGVLNMNRFLFDPSELDDDDDEDGTDEGNRRRCPTVTLPATDYRTVHAAGVLNVRNGDTIRAGVVGDGWTVRDGDGGGSGEEVRSGRATTTTPPGGLVTDEAVVTWIPEGKIKKAQPTKLGKPPGSLRVRLESLRPAAAEDGDGDGDGEDVRVSLLLALPRPLQLGRILPVVAQMGVDHLILCSARKVPRDYFGSHLFRRPGELRRLLVEGLCQAGDDARLPRVTVVRKLGSYVEGGELDGAFPKESVARVIAHPQRRSSAGAAPDDDDVTPLRMREVRFPGEEEGSRTPSSSDGRRGTQHRPPRRMLLAVGPEGGWDEGDELDMFHRSGFQRVTLGRRVLRTDVAVISLLALARDVCDDDDDTCQECDFRD